jgi:hypothetical protein
MAELVTSKYVREAPVRKSFTKDVKTMVPSIISDKAYGDLGFHMYWLVVQVPVTMVVESHKHDFPQYLIFSSLDADDLVDLKGGVVEMTLSEDGVNMEKHVITKATSIYIAPGLYHCPLVFKKVTKPILLMDMYYTDDYKRVRSDGSIIQIKPRE